MTTATTTNRLGPDNRVTQARVVRSEWLKLASLRSTWISLAAALAGTVAVGLLISWATDNRWNHMDPIERIAFDPVARSLVGVFLASWSSACPACCSSVASTALA